jgi:carbon-monoxide dehydrogenase large subunit
MFVMERLLDTAADKLAVSRDEIRRRNLISPTQMPYSTQVAQRDGSTMVYDSGDYPECQRRALEAAGWDDFPARRDEARKRGRHIGIGPDRHSDGRDCAGAGRQDDTGADRIRHSFRSGGPDPGDRW